MDQLAELEADVRARDVEARMTDDERFSLVLGLMGGGEMWPLRDARIPPGVPVSAGYCLLYTSRCV